MSLRRAGIVAVVFAVALASGPSLSGWGFARAETVITENAIRGHMEMLASDALRGRGSGTRDEFIAATYVASELRRYGFEPAGGGGEFIQTADVTDRPPAAVASPELEDDRSAPTVSQGHTWNAVGRLAGRNTSSDEAILLGAHIDHLGVRGSGSDTIYNGADDDASGVTAVLELAEALAHGKRPARTVIVAFFGSEEDGGFGAKYFLTHSPVPLTDIVADLEFEMIGRPDPKIPGNALWLTGFERTTLGPALEKHGAAVVADPRPEQHFFERSDNIALARQGVVAQTLSSFGLHADYHRPTDDLSHIDFPHMTTVIRGIYSAINWLANSSFRPAWRPGQRP